jgi:2-oxoglutarate ferredoxin oxidoreductase subunit alpha
MGREFIDGNEATARSAVRAGCDFFAGYPITPASTIFTYMLELSGGKNDVVIQAEDEIAAVGMCIGASMAGRRAMTATSGPGMSLFSENIGLAIMGETPLVIVDVQRQGPATGSATKGAEGDIQFARWGTSGGLPVIAVSPADASEAYELTYRAFNLAERFRAPVVVLSNKEIGMTRQSVRLDTIRLPRRAVRRRAGRRGRYRPHGFDRLEQVPAFSPFGGPHPARFTTSTHDREALLVTEPARIQEMLDHYAAKIESAVEEISLYRADMQQGAKTLVISYGVVSRSAAVAVEQARARRRKVSSLVLQTLWPVPEKVIREAMTGVKKVVVPEMNMGQYRLEIERLAQPGVRVSGVNKMDTTLLSPGEIAERGGI